MKNKLRIKITSLLFCVSMCAFLSGCYQVMPLSEASGSETTSCENTSEQKEDTAEQAADASSSASSTEHPSAGNTQRNKTLAKEPVPEEKKDAKTTPSYSIKEEEKDGVIQYGAYYYSVPNAPTDHTNRVGTLEKGTKISVIGTVDMYDGSATTWRGKAESWIAFSLNEHTYFVPSEYVTENAPVTAEPSVSSTEPVKGEAVAATSVSKENSGESTPQPSQESAPESVAQPDVYTTVYQTQTSKESPRQLYLHQLSMKLAAGESVQIPSSDWEPLLNFYAYRIGIGPASGNGLQYSYAASDPDTWTVSALSSMDLEHRYSSIVNKFGAVSYPGDDIRTMRETYQRVHGGITYDDTYTSSSFDECMRDSRGVCWFYAQCFSTLLNYEGIPCYTMAGLCNGGWHEWCHAYVDGNWMDLDPTMDYGGDLYPGVSYIEDYSWCHTQG